MISSQHDHVPRAVLLATVLAATAAVGHAQTLTTLYTFTGGADGGAPKGTLVQGKDGNFYGTTSGPGTVFKITPDGTLTTLHKFTGADGVGVFGTLAQGSDGAFYGTTTGSTPGAGTIFKITPSGTFSTLHTFSVTDGNSPWGGLAQGSDDNFYGTTTAGGQHAAGTIFKISPAGAFTNLYVFSLSDGADPIATLTQGPDGNFYGTTNIGGAHLIGSVFKITPGGSLTTLHSFSGMDGSMPWGALALGKDGNFHGTTTTGGAFSQGTVFQITPAGALKTLYSFDGAHGQGPIAGLASGPDGNFYGNTQTGGTSTLFGIVFEITPGGTFTVLHNFSGTDGSFPYGALTLGSDGNFYGTTDGGGKNAIGTVFKISPAPVTPPTVTPPPVTPPVTPTVTVTAVQNAGSHAAGAVAPGEIVMLTGTGMGPAVQAMGVIDPASGLLSSSLGGVSVQFDGVAAPLVSVSATQVTAVVPYEVAGETTTQMQVSFNGQTSTPLSLAVAASLPGLFSADFTGAGQALALNQDSSPNSDANPANPGDVVTLFGTGEGQTDPPGVDGQIAGDVAPQPILPVSVTIEGQPAQVMMYGGTTGQAVGYFQVTAQVPAGIDPGDQPVVLTIGSAGSQQNVTIAISGN